jgi:hypothetical protein
VELSLEHLGSTAGDDIEIFRLELLVMDWLALHGDAPVSGFGADPGHG